jgi:hypothetical protein
MLNFPVITGSVALGLSLGKEAPKSGLLLNPLTFPVKR